MSLQTIDEPTIAQQSAANPFAVLRTGIFLYIAIAESLLTLGMITWSILLVTIAEPENVDLLQEIVQLILLLVFGSFIAKKVKTMIGLGEQAIRITLRYCTIVLLISIGITLAYNYLLIDLFPESYWIKVMEYNYHKCLYPDSSWNTYYFIIAKYAVIGLFFTQK